MSSKWPMRISVYGAGDAARAFSALEAPIRKQLVNLNKVATNKQVAAAAQLDSNRSATLRWVLDSRGRTSPEELARETNTGDPAELIEFAKWADRELPADIDVLVLSGHGLAWQDDLARDALGLPSRGVSTLRRQPLSNRNPFGSKSTSAARRAILPDGATPSGVPDFLSNSELAIALERIQQLRGRKLGVLVFDACLMSSAEVLMELTSSVEYVIGGVDEISASGYDHAMVAEQITAGNGITSRKIASAYAESGNGSDVTDSCVATNLDSGDFVEFVQAFAAFSENALTWATKNGPNRDSMERVLIRGSTIHERFRGSLADLSSLRTGLEEEGAPAPLLELVDISIKKAARCIVGKALGAQYRNFLGLSVYSPALEKDYQLNRPEYTRLKFSYETGWSKVLDHVYGFE